MRIRTLIMVLALTLIAGVVFAADPTCVPAPGTTTTTTTTETGTAMGTACAATGSPDVEQFNRSFVSRYYGLSDTTVADLRQRHDWGAIYFMANVAARTGRPISEIASLSEQGMSCNDIACKYNVALADVTTPVTITTRVAGYTTEVGMGPMQSMWITDKRGNIILDAREDARLKKMGYRWQDIAIAANISAETGYPVYQILDWTTAGMTWQQIANMYGVSYDDVYNTSCYPFPQSREGMAIRQPIGAGPMAPCPAPAGAQPVCPPAGQPVCPPGTQPSTVEPVAPATPPAQPAQPY